MKPRRKLAFEAHRLSKGRAGRWLQGLVVRRVGTVIAVTAKLREDLIVRGANPARAMVAHDGIRTARFAGVPSQAEARRIIGWPEAAFIVGYAGRLQTMAMDKGVGKLVEALRDVEGATLALVGGPDDMAEILREQWVKLGMDAGRFLNAGQVAPERVPMYLSGFDVCAMPFPWTEHFAYYASPMKLFEYMASGRAIIASDLPSTAEVVTDGRSALLYPVGDVSALSAGIKRLRDDSSLREQLAAQAYQDVLEHYTWAARAKAILNNVMWDG